MKKIALISLLLVINSCHSQDKEKKNDNKEGKSSNIKIEIPINPKTMQTYTTEKFDIENYFKHSNKISRTYEYETNNGKIMETDFDNSFMKVLTPKGSLFTTQKEYYKSGPLKSKWETFGDRGFIKGIRYEYDEKGKLIKAEDYDKPFKFTWEQVKKYVEQDLKLDFFKDEVNINNYNGLSGGKPTWDISFKGNYKDVFGVYYVTLDGTDGELLKVKKILGRDGEQQIIFEKK
ncbi:hypothetical protein AB670_02359 [Chryseobacterium sp. MOF25P]|uniref:hypothetical protein n=1 Tax=unclassified Chryseobacterium TaxID=2593645 RepID=UPI0008055742|nr:MULTISPECIES: hypothetical protein [unclassified Chryseobacterium]OBW41242.1 hypothetical protein AB670_02359 [Chryseobacterium sp. MOF25P]OBW44463.1 hypothetical protein AB671_03438 [Chryseobacterium sp. BGARF1]